MWPGEKKKKKIRIVAKYDSVRAVCDVRGCPVANRADQPAIHTGGIQLKDTKNNKP